MQNPNDTYTQFAVENHIGSLNFLANHVHQVNIVAGWWTDKDYPKKIQSLKDRGFTDGAILQICEALDISDKLKRDPAGLLMLSVSELSEAMEGIRKNLMDDKLPHRKMFEVEIADCIIRLLDIAGFYNLDLSGAMIEKMAFNAVRPDHKLENRLKEGGKAF